MKTRYAFAMLIASLALSAPAFAQRCAPDDRRCHDWGIGLKTASAESSKSVAQTGNFQRFERPSTSDALMRLFLRLTDDPAKSAKPAPRR